MGKISRERIDSRDFTKEEKLAVEEIKYLMDMLNTEKYSKEEQDEFVATVVGAGVATAMQERFILTKEESDILIAALRKITGKVLS